MKKNKKILIVGGTGFIGYYVAKKAISKKYLVNSISTRKPKKIRYIKSVKYLLCDISKKNHLNKIIKNKDYDFVVNLGGHVNHRDKEKIHKSHFIGCKNLAEVFSSKKIKSFIQLGSGAEYGNVKSPIKENSKCRPGAYYGSSKLKATKFLQNLYKRKNFPVTILRLFQTYGPKQDSNRVIPISINKCIKNQFFPCSDGKQLRDFVHVNDLVNAIFKVFNNSNTRGQIINIGTGKPIKIKKLITTISKMIKGGYPEFGKIALRRDETEKNFPNITKAKKILNWLPKISLKRGLKQTIRSYINYE